MILHQTQSVVAQDKHRFRVVNCGRRWGKTTLAILEMVAKGIFKDGSRIAYIAPTIQQARDIAWAELKRVCNPIIVKSKEAPSLEIVIQTKNGKESTIFLRGWENVETLRGQYFDFIVIDEIASMRNFQLNWEEVIRPTLTDRKGEVLFISTPKGFNHFYDLFNFNDPDYKSFHFTSYDNPHLPVEELDKAKKEIPADRFAQEYMADFRKSEGLVYKEFSRDLHVYETAPKFEKKGYYGGIDFGFTNPCAVIHCNVTKDDHYYISEEWYKTGRTEEQVGDYVKTCGFNGVAPDPESPSAIEVLNQKGLNVIEVVKGKDSIKSGIDLIRGLFKSNRIHIHRNCINLIQELETYSYPPKTTNHNEPEVPIKENDHALDSLRYLITALQRTQVKSFVAQKQDEQWSMRRNQIASNSTK